MKSSIQSLFREAVDLTGSTWASVVAILSIVIWALCGVLFFGFGTAYNLLLNSVTTIITFIMVFLIQHSQNRDTKAIQAKLDEIISVTSGARNELVGIEKESSEKEIEEARKSREECDDGA